MALAVRRVHRRVDNDNPAEAVAILSPGQDRDKPAERMRDDDRLLGVSKFLNSLYTYLNEFRLDLTEQMASFSF